MDDVTLHKSDAFTHAGWLEIDGKTGFLSESGFLTSHGLDENRKANLPDSFLNGYILPHPPTGEELPAAVRASLGFLDLGPRTLTAPVWAAIWAAVFTEVQPLKTVIWIYGPPQSGKSTLTSLAFAHFGSSLVNGRQFQCLVGWTPAALERIMFAAKDLPLLFEAPIADKASMRRMSRNIHQIIRRVANRSANKHLNADLSERQEFLPRGLVMVTAEFPLSVGESAKNRVLQIPATGENGYPVLALEQAQKQAEAGLYGQAMSAFLQWMAANWERANTAFASFLDEANTYARDPIEISQSLLWADSFAILHAAQRVALMAFVELGAISAQDAATILLDNRDALAQLVTMQEFPEKS